MKKELKQLITLVQTQEIKDGVNDTNIPSLKIFKSSHLTQHCLPTVYEPSLIFILQGSKLVIVGNKTIEYDSSSYLISSSFMPVSGKITQANEEEPYIALKIIFTLEQIFEAIESFSIEIEKFSGTKMALSSYHVTDSLLDAIVRFANLLKTPEDIKALSSLYLKEILYRLLISNNNIELKQLAFVEGNAYKIHKAVIFINENLYESLQIEELAQYVNMSVSSFHKHFKTIISISPLQYIKTQRLQKAKSLMISENMDITGVSYYVGYQSTSQFSREYSSYFGVSPSLDIKNMRQQLSS